MNKYTPVIGLEVHVELKTESKMFCGCSADYFGQQPNTHTCPVCLGLPGALPVPNRKAIEWCVLIGLSLNCEIQLFSKFDRKNYFYPDLPKGYQISQYDQPFCLRGKITLNSGKKIGITRVHMEEDTAKLTHAIVDNERVSLVDFNRSGVPLVEIVTEPDFDNSADVKEYLQKLQQIVRFLDVSNADMEKGNMRLEPNISLRSVILGRETTPKSLKDAGQASMTMKDLPPYKVEVKNINSFRFVEKAINFELIRQEKLLEQGITPRQETRGWDEQKQVTVLQRVKEEASDYRYFPEPDIPPIRFSSAQIDNLRAQMPELPDVKQIRFIKNYALNAYDAEILTRDTATADYFEEAVKVLKSVILASVARPESLRDAGQASMTTKQIANAIINKKVDLTTTLPAQFIQNLLASQQTTTVDDTELEAIIQQVLLDNPKAISDYKKGKENVMMFLIGQVMKAAQGKAEVEIVKEILIKFI